MRKLKNNFFNIIINYKNNNKIIIFLIKIDFLIIFNIKYFNFNIILIFLFFYFYIIFYYEM